MTWSNPFAAVPLHSLLTAWDEMVSFPPADEGWNLFESDTYGFEIERDEDEDAFATDDEALAYVRARAKGGSPLHQMALAIHEAQERENRDAAEAAGYRFRLVQLEAGIRHRAVRPNWSTVGDYETEVAAWSAAWRDLQENG